MRVNMGKALAASWLFVSVLFKMCTKPMLSMLFINCMILEVVSVADYSMPGVNLIYARTL